MFKNILTSFRFLILVPVAVVAFTGCAGLTDPNYGGGGYGGGYGGGGYYGGDPYYRDPYYGSSYQDRRERERLEEERRRLERERERLERERERQEPNRPPPPPPLRPVYDRCPPGFSPSENKCSREERARGCKDIRMPSGLGCVKR